MLRSVPRRRQPWQPVLVDGVAMDFLWVCDVKEVGMHTFYSV